MLAALTALPQAILRLLLLGTLLAFVGTTLAINLDSIGWYSSAVTFWNDYVVEPALGLSAWVPVGTVGTLVTWWLGFFAAMLAIRVARFVISFIAGSGD